MHTLQVAFAVVILSLLGGWLGCHVVSAIRTGVANAAGSSHRRSKHPVMFWLTVAVQILFSIMCFALLVTRIFKH